MQGHSWPHGCTGAYRSIHTYMTTDIWGCTWPPGAIGDTGVYVHDHKGVKNHKGLLRYKLSQGHVKDTWLLGHVEAYMAIEVCGVIHDNRHVRRYT